MQKTEPSTERRRSNVKETYIVGAQGDPPPAAGAELGLAVGAEVAAAVGELGLPADSAGGGVVLLLRLLLPPRLHPNAAHFLFVALELLVERPEGRRVEGLVLDVQVRVGGGTKETERNQSQTRDTKTKPKNNNNDRDLDKNSELLLTPTSHSSSAQSEFYHVLKLRSLERDLQQVIY